MLFRSKSRRERAMGQAEHLVHLGRESGETLRHAVPVARDRLEEFREQAQGLLYRIEDMREQAQPAIDEGKKSAQDAKQSAAHAASAVALASEISPKRSRSKLPFVLVVLLLLGVAARFWWKRRDGQGGDSTYRPEPPATDLHAL